MTPLVEILYSPSLELIMLVIALIAEVILAIVVYESNPKSATNRIFALLTIFTMFWLLSTYVVRIPPLYENALIMHRLGIIFAAPMSLLFFLLAHTIPSEKLLLPMRYFYLSIGATLVMVLLNGSPYAFIDVVDVGGVMQPIAGAGLMPFSIISTIFSILAVVWLIKKYNAARGVEQKQIQLVLIGIIVMLALIIATLLVPIIVFNSTVFLPFTPLYALAFLGMTGYAITKYRLFNVKVLLAQALTLVICVVLFARIFGETTLSAQIIDVWLLIFVVVFGFFLVRSVKREVQQREEIEKLSDEKSEFMTFASHEIRNPITAMRGYASLIVDGTFGDVSPRTKDSAQKILVMGNEVLALISEYLNKSKVELGQIAYNTTEFDVGSAVATVVEGYRPHAQQKGLKMTVDIDTKESLRIKADEPRLKEVVGNLIDNSLKYTPHGSITVSVHRHGVHARILIQDTGVGIDQDVLPHLFKKFSRADKMKVNILGSGIGLYLAKNFIEAMGGRVWAESDGHDKGSRFIVEFEAVA